MSPAASASIVPARPSRFAGLAWLMVVVAALWPVWSWSVARFRDGSDEPWGIVAIGALAALTIRDWRRVSGPPRGGWVAGGAALTLTGVGTGSGRPWLE